MLESLEGRRGEVRVRPPLPAIKGLFGQPTIVNNVVTLASVPWILQHGADTGCYLDRGNAKSITLVIGGSFVSTAFGNRWRVSSSGRIRASASFSVCRLISCVTPCLII